MKEEEGTREDGAWRGFFSQVEVEPRNQQRAINIDIVELRSCSFLQGT